MWKEEGILTPKEVTNKHKKIYMLWILNLKKSIRTIDGLINIRFKIMFHYTLVINYAKYSR